MSRPLVSPSCLIALLTLFGCGEILGLDDTNLAASEDAGDGSVHMPGVWLPGRQPFDLSPLEPPTAGASGSTSMDGGGSTGGSGGGAGTIAPTAGGGGQDASTLPDADSDGGPKQPPVDDDAGIWDDDAGSAEWLPNVLPGLVLWLDAADGVTSSGLPSHRAVSEWKDRSGNGNDAVQATQAQQPRLVSGAVNGLPAIEFNGRNTVLLVADNDALNFDAEEDFTIEVVAAWSNPPVQVPYTSSGYGALLKKQIWNTPVDGFALWANSNDGAVESKLSMSATGVLAESSLVGLNDRRFRLCSGRRVKDKVGVEVNGFPGVPHTLSPDLSVSAAGTPLEIGGADPLQSLDGVIAEIVIVSGRLSSEQADQLKAYFNAKYALWE